MNHNIELIARNQYLDLAEKIYNAHKKGKKLEEIETPKITFGTFLNSSIQIKVNHMKHIERIQQESIEFLKKMKTLQQEFHEEITTQIKEGKVDEEDIGIQNIYVGLVPIFKE